MREVACRPELLTSRPHRSCRPNRAAQITEDAQGLLKVPGRVREITHQAPHDPEVTEDLALAKPAAQITVDAWGV